MIVIVPLIFIPLKDDIFNDFSLLFYPFWALMITSLKWMHMDKIIDINEKPEIKKN